MSKSLGNVVDPLKMMEVHGADIMRLWTMTSDYAEDIRIGKDTLKNTADLYRRIRNTIRFVLGALDGFAPAEMLKESEYKDLPELESLILHNLYSMDGLVRKSVEEYDFGNLANALHRFCNNELSAFYFDIRKDRLYCDRPDSYERRACRTVLFHVFDCLTAWLAPILSFTAEEAWQHRPLSACQARGIDASSIHLRDFPNVPDAWFNPALAKKWEQVRDVRRVVLGALEPHRAAKTIGSSLEAAPVIYIEQAEQAHMLKALDMAEICITSGATIEIGAGPADAFRLQGVNGIAVVFKAAEGKKCLRCWKILPSVGSDPDYPDLSPRDADAVRWVLQNRKAA